MSGNSVFEHHNSGVLGLAAVEAPIAITSEWIDEQLAETYQRSGIRPGLLASVAGIEERRWWEEGTTFADAAALAGRAAIERAGIDPARIGLLVSTSVCKEHLEPSIACSVHHQLGLSSSCMNFDLGNACLAFMDGMHVASSLLDAGAIDYALVVDGEGSRHTQQTTLDRLRQPTATAADVFAEFASLTLGSGAAAMVLGRLDQHPDAHRVARGVTRAATQHHGLCVGTLERMTTDTAGLLAAGLELAEQAWADIPAEFDWGSHLDWYILHQVSSVHTSKLCELLGIDAAKAPLTYPTYGNVGPAAVPITLAGVQDRIEPGQRVLCLGIGSGLNTSATEIVW